MKVKQFVEILKNIEDQNRDIQILIGDEDKDYFASEEFEVMHTDDVEQCLEIFIHKKDLYEIFDDNLIAGVDFSESINQLNNLL